MRGATKIYGEGTEDSTLYRGIISLIRAWKAYKLGEEVILTIHGEAERIGSGWGAWLSWATTYKVFDESGAPLASDTRHHSIAPWTEHDYAEDRFDISLGNMPEHAIHGYVELWGGGSPDVKLDTRNFTVSLTGAPSIPWLPILLGGLGISVVLLLTTRRKK